MPVTAVRLVVLAVAVVAAGLARAEDLRLYGETAAEADTPRDRLDIGLSPDSGSGLFDDGATLLAPRWSDRSLDAASPRRRGLLALDWQHALSEVQSLSLSARYGDYGYGDADVPSAGSGRAAALSWSALLGSDARVSGRLFLGDESVQEPGTGLLPRRYYGLLLEGRYAVARDHTPFASLRWQRSDIDNGDHGITDWRRESESRLAAGWSWQIRSDWDLRAEASYRFLEDSPDLLDADRARFGVSTRYGFR